MSAALKGIPGVKNVKVDFDTKVATVETEGVDGKVLVSAVNAVDGGDRFTATLK